MGSVQVVCHHEQRGPIRVRFRKLRIELDRTREIIERRFELTGLCQEHATVVDGAPTGGVGSNCIVEIENGFFVVTGFGFN
jgi:hypothetical protein